MNIDEHFSLALETSILKQFWVSKHHIIFGINQKNCFRSLLKNKRGFKKSYLSINLYVGNGLVDY